jgi:prophage antirepressor-like protein
MSEEENGLPCVQFFYREGKQLRAIALSNETWFSAADVMGQLGWTMDEQRAPALLMAMGAECCAIPCTDGAERLSLWCTPESDLMRIFNKMERFASKPGRTA